MKRAWGGGLGEGRLGDPSPSARGRRIRVGVAARGGVCCRAAGVGGPRGGACPRGPSMPAAGAEPNRATGLGRLAGGGPPDMRDCFARIVLHVLSGGGVASCRRSPSRLPPRWTRSPTPAGSQLPHSIAIGRRAECFPFAPLGVPPHSITDLVCGLPCPGAPSRGETEAGGQSKIHHGHDPRFILFVSSPLLFAIKKNKCVLNLKGRIPNYSSSLLSIHHIS